MNKDQAVMLVFLSVFLFTLLSSVLFHRARNAWRRSAIKWVIRDIKADAKAWCERVIYCHHNARVLADTEWRLSVLLDHASGGQISKAGYDTQTMITYVDDHIQTLTEEAIAEARENMREEIHDGYANAIETAISEVRAQYVGLIESVKSEAVRKYIDDLPPRVREKLNKNLAKATGGAYAPIKPKDFAPEVKSVAPETMQPVRHARKHHEGAPGLRSTVADPQR